MSVSNRPIVIDMREVRPNATGVGRSTKSLISAVVALAPDQRFVLLTCDPQDLGDLGDRANVEWQIAPYAQDQHPRADWWLNVRLPQLLKRLDARLYHGPAFLIPQVRLTIPTVLTIHDLSMFELREYYARRFALYMRAIIRRGVRMASHVVAVSGAVRDELARQFGIEGGRVSVVHNAIGEEWSEMSPAEPIKALQVQLKLPAQYLLSVGTLEPRKNPLVLAEALRRMPDWKRPLLVWVGQCGYRGRTLQNEVLKILGASRFRWISNIDDPNLRILMAGSCGVVCPSLSEGFGITALEAMAMGTPVICSDIPAHREVAGDAALYANPLDPMDFSERIEEALGRPDRREALIHAGHQRAKAFDWQQSATQLKNLYDRMVH